MEEIRLNMTILSWIGIGFGIWLIHSAIKNKSPLADLRDMFGGT